MTRKPALETVSFKIVCEIPRRFERSSPSNFRTQGSFIHINSGKIFERDFFRQIALQNLQRKNLGFSETEKVHVIEHDEGSCNGSRTGL